MLRHVERMLYAGAAVMTVAGYLSLAAVEDIGPPILLLPILIFAIGPAAQRLDGTWGGYRHLTGSVTFFYTATILFQYVVIGLFSTVVSLASFIILHKLAHKRTSRDYHQLMLMAFFLLLCGCSRAPGAGAGLAVVLFLLAGSAAYAALHVWSELKGVGEEVGAEERVFWKDGMGVAGELPVGVLLGWAGGGAALTVAVMVGLFLVTPRIEAGILRTEEFEQATTGISEEVDLGFSGTIATDTSVAMRVRFPEEDDQRYDGPLHWRVRPLHGYTGSRWEAGDLEEGFDDPGIAVTFQAYQKGAISRSLLGGGRLVMQDIQLEDRPTSGLPCLPLVQKVRCERSLTWSSWPGYTVRAADENAGLNYIAWSEVRDFSPETLRACPQNYEEVLGGENQDLLTRHFLSNEAAALTEDVTAGAETPYDKAAAIERWLSSENFTYTLNVPAYGGRNPINAFLLEGRQGHCELFATAMALMLRSQGIPARVVTGYRGGEWVEGGRTCLVPRSMAHLWVEVYFIGKGWVTFDPSPPADQIGLIRSRVSRLWAYASLRANLLWYRYVVGYRGGLSFDALRSGNWRFWQGWNRPEESTGVPRRPIALPVLLTAAGLLLGLWALAGIWRNASPGQEARQLSLSQRRAQRLVRPLKREALRRRLIARTATAEEAAEAMGAHHPWTQAELDAILEAYNAARFGRGGLSQERFSGLRQRLRVALAAARKTRRNR